MKRSLLLSLFVCPLALHAGGVLLYEIGTAEVRLASAGWAARAEDPSTTFTNPAGLTRIADRQVQLGIEAINGAFENTYVQLFSANLIWWF